MLELGIGLIVISLAAEFWMSLNEERQRITKLITYGKRIEAEVVKIETNFEITKKAEINGRIVDGYFNSRGKEKIIKQQKYIIQCKWEGQGGTLLFFSEPLSWDPTGFVKNTITVYVDESDNSNYYVATGGLKAN